MVSVWLRVFGKNLCCVLISALVLGARFSFAISVGTVDCCVKLGRRIRVSRCSFETVHSIDVDIEIDIIQEIRTICNKMG